MSTFLHKGKSTWKWREMRVWQSQRTTISFLRIELWVYVEESQKMRMKQTAGVWSQKMKVKAP